MGNRAPAETSAVNTDALPHVIDPTESGIIHTIELDVRRALLAHEDISFGSLVVRRVPGGVCLEGTFEECPKGVDIPALVKDATGVDVVKNRLVVKRTTADLPPKG